MWKLARGRSAPRARGGRTYRFLWHVGAVEAGTGADQTKRVAIEEREPAVETGHRTKQGGPMRQGCRRQSGASWSCLDARRSTRGGKGLASQTAVTAPGADADVDASQLAIPSPPVRRALAQSSRSEGLSRMQATSSPCETGGHVARGEQAVVANTDEATREDMQEEATQELHFGTGFGLAVAGLESDGAVGNA